VELFQLPNWRSSNTFRAFDIHPEGDRFLFITTGASQDEPLESYEGVGNVVIVANWFEELEQRMGAGR